MYRHNTVVLQLNEKRCIGCTSCVGVCPQAVFQMAGRKAIVADRDACTGCGACVRNCPRMVITLARAAAA